MTHGADWSVFSERLLQRERWPGRVSGYAQVIPLVYPGQEVLPDQPVVRLERGAASGSMQSLPHPSHSLSESMKLRVIQGGQSFEANPASLTLPAGLRGRVVDVTRRGGVVIESRAVMLQGLLGAGRQVAGVLTLWQGSSGASSPWRIPPGALLVVPGPLNFALLRQAQNSGVSGIIASSISFSDLEGYLRTDYIQLLNTSDIELAQSRLPDLTLLLTEGLGTIAMPVHILNLLNFYQGSIALLSGTTSQRYQLVPELVISLPVQQQQKSVQESQPDLMLALGALVHVYAGEEAGSIGLIDYFFAAEQKFASGIHTRALRIRREDGSYITVPVTHVKRIN